MNLSKTDDNDRTRKNDANTHLDIWSMFLFGQVPHTIQAIQVTFIGILKTLYYFAPYRRKITYHPLLIGFFLRLIWKQDVINNMLHLHVAQLPSHSSSWQRCWSEQTISTWHWSKRNITQLKNEGRETWHKFFTAFTL